MQERVVLHLNHGELVAMGSHAGSLHGTTHLFDADHEGAARIINWIFREKNLKAPFYALEAEIYWYVAEADQALCDAVKMSIPPDV